MRRLSLCFYGVIKLHEFVFIHEYRYGIERIGFLISSCSHTGYILLSDALKFTRNLHGVVHLLHPIDEAIGRRLVRILSRCDIALSSEVSEPVPTCLSISTEHDRQQDAVSQSVRDAVLTAKRMCHSMYVAHITLRESGSSTIGSS